MSEEKIQQAKIQARESAERFDAALDQLAGRIESGADMLRGMGGELSQAATSLGEDLKTRIFEPLTGSFDEIRESAEKQFSRIDEHPIATWMTVFMSGLFLGFLFAKGAKGRETKVTSLHH